MSDVENAVDGADAARLPDEKPETPAAQETPQQESATADVEPKPEPPKKRSDGGFQRRINELTWKTRELERQLAERDARERQPAPADPNVDPVAYVRQLAQEEARALVEQERRAQTEQQQRREFEQAQAKFQREADQFAEANPDFWDAVANLDASVPFGPELVEVIGQSDVGPALTYYLAQNVDEAAQIASLPPHIAAARIARIEAKLTAPRQSKPTNTPSPPPVLGGSSVVSKDPAKMTYAEYRAYRQGK